MCRGRLESEGSLNEHDFCEEWAGRKGQSADESELLGARHLLTDDLQDGFALQGVTFINSFQTID